MGVVAVPFHSRTVREDRVFLDLPSYCQGSTGWLHVVLEAKGRVVAGIVRDGEAVVLPRLVAPVDHDRLRVEADRLDADALGRITVDQTDDGAVLRHADAEGVLPELLSDAGLK